MTKTTTRAANAALLKHQGVATESLAKSDAKSEFPTSPEHASKLAHEASKHVSKVGNEDSDDYDEDTHHNAHMTAYTRHVLAAGMHAAAGNHDQAKKHWYTALKDHDPFI